MPPVVTLKRGHYLQDGILGVLVVSAELMDTEFATLEHAYTTVDGRWDAKLPEGSYTCKRGCHTLPNRDTLETFEVLDVPGHTGILFHWGNYNHDSDGCILVGSDGLVGIGARGEHMLLRSRIALADFMDLLDGVVEFQLTVKRGEAAT